MLNKLLCISLISLSFLPISKAENCTINSAISVESIISNSLEYHQKKICVSGFLNLGFETSALYASFSDYKNAKTFKAIWINNSQLKKYKCLNKKYILMDGMFNAKNRGHLKLYSGKIINIKHMSYIE